MAQPLGSQQYNLALQNFEGTYEEFLQKYEHLIQDENNPGAFQYMNNQSSQMAAYS